MKQLLIKQINLYKCGIGMDFTYSFGHRKYSSCIIFELRSGDYFGFGEAMCRADDDWEIAESVASSLLGKDAFRGEAIIPDLIKAKKVSIAVRESLDIAVHDLIGRTLGVPVHLLLGGKRRDKVPGMPVIHVGPPKIMAKRAKKWVSAGYRYIKVKLRGNIEIDVEALAQVREAVGNEIKFQVDANSGYKSVTEAITAVSKMNKFNIEIVEDLIEGTVSDYRAIRKSISPKFMIDHDAYWPNVFNIISNDCADIINHHPHNQGGLIRALKIDAVAESAGIPSAIGSSGLLGIQDAAFQSLSSVISLTRPCEDIGLVPYYSGPTKGEYYWSDEPSVIKEAYRQQDGMIWIPDKPGLGIEVDCEKLSRMTKEKRVVK